MTKTTFSAASDHPNAPYINANEAHASYFQNGLGEQLIFTANLHTGEFILYHSDTDYRPHPLTPDWPFGPHGNVYLDSAEALWLKACLIAAAETARLLATKYNMQPTLDKLDAILNRLTDQGTIIFNNQRTLPK